MKIGIICNVEKFYDIAKGDDYNYIKFISDELSKDNEIVLFNWRDMSENLNISKGIIGNKCSYSQVKNINLDDCDMLFIKQLGKIHKEQKEFMNFLNYLESFKGKSLNPIKTIRDNLSKEYLIKMQKDKLPVIPTIKLKQETSFNDVKKIKDKFSEFEEIVIKPYSFGEQGQGVRLISSFKNENEFNLYMKNYTSVIVQPVIPEIFTHGEYSLIFLGNEFSHGIHKHTGEFKINFKDGDKYKQYFPTDEEINLAKRILEYWPNEIGYSRIDFMKHKGKPIISEVEMVNPSFYIENLPGVGERFIEKFKFFINNNK